MHKASHYWWFIRQKIYFSQWLNCPVNFGNFCEYAQKKPCYVTWIEFYAQMKSHLTWWVLKLPCVLNILCSKVSLIFQVNSFQSIQCWNYYGSIQNPTWSLSRYRGFKKSKTRTRHFKTRDSNPFTKFNIWSRSRH